MKRSLCISFIFLFSTQLWAQDTDFLIDETQGDTSYIDFTEAEWRQMVQGRTVNYKSSDQFYALEHYDESGTGVEIQMYDGSCMRGNWYVENSYFCFLWEDNPATPDCFRHLKKGNQILIAYQGIPIQSGVFQIAASVTDLPLSCSQALTS